MLQYNFLVLLANFTEGNFKVCTPSIHPSVSLANKFFTLLNHDKWQIEFKICSCPLIFVVADLCTHFIWPSSFFIVFPRATVTCKADGPLVFYLCRGLSSRNKETGGWNWLWWLSARPIPVTTLQNNLWSLLRQYVHPQC